MTRLLVLLPLLFAWHGRVDPPGRLDAVVRRSSAELHEFADRIVGGFFTRDGTGPVLVLPGESYVFDASPERWSLMHELAHHLSSYALARQRIGAARVPSPPRPL